MFQNAQVNSVRWMTVLMVAVLLAGCSRPEPTEGPPPEGPPPDEMAQPVEPTQPAEPAATDDQAAKVKEAIAAMKAGALELGEPKLDGDNLVFGETVLNDNFEIVDAIQTQFGGTATFFVKKDDGFTRISTNVMNDGERAVGTVLDPEGPVIVSIRNGEAYYGQADILGSLYDTGYEPIQDSAGEIIGIYYVGYKLGE